MFRSFSATVLAAALSFFIIGAANAQVSNPDKVYKAVNTSDVLSILAESGYQTSLAQVNGQSIITAMRGSQAPLIMTIVPCTTAEMPNCRVAVIMSFAPISVLPGATPLAQLAALAGVNAYEQFLPVKFLILDPSMLSSMRSEFYFYGGTRGNIAASIAAVAEVSELAFATLASMGQQPAAFSATLDTPLGVTPGKIGTGANSLAATFGALKSAAPKDASGKEPAAQARATREALDFIATLVSSKAFREDLLHSN